jgi:HNH endonuclease
MGASRAFKNVPLRQSVAAKNRPHESRGILVVNFSQEVFMQLSLDQKNLHHRALALTAQHRRIESTLIVVLKEIDKTKLYKKLGQPSLFTYAVKLLGLTESVAYGFISVARKSDQVAPLFKAIEEQRLSVAKASRIVAALTNENAEALIEFANSHSTRETEFEVARLRPKTAGPDRIKPLSENLIRLEMSLSKAVFAKFTRARALVASRGRADTGFESVLDAVLSEFLKRRDPVKRAERAIAKKVAKCSNSKSSGEETSSAETSAVPPSTMPPAVTANFQPGLCALRVRSRQPLTAAQKHVVFARDGGRCTHIDSSGGRCATDRWLHLHHLTPVSRGGRNDPSNLTTLCSFHHDLAHQGTWLRERGSRYSA